MRLDEVEHGDRLKTRLLFRFVSAVSGMRLPDAARVAMYHPDYVGPALNAWTQAAMRGESDWSVAERELMAALVATWNSCPFCVGAHSAVAVHGMDADVVARALDDYRAAPLSPQLRAALLFLEKLTRDPDGVDAADARAAFAAGVSPQRWRTRPPSPPRST
ncbi:carboxymuconolactone decarboxylase family protein [Microbacterium elymi]|uniref:Carboxymuconolactone decarboxylase family protein n=1 Tax=Microbacterium elymi TaxID=2909587 RepID=A0ABY5NGW4_9MICO|nr:carboxymuconolactone decarboxylase family protein [Microbacterium elymi]UUT34398.1 carboxymuconolactone decarboxylase family protein [Microbacterium elymi]